jgi:hypothetical protein
LRRLPDEPEESGTSGKSEAGIYIERKKRKKRKKGWEIY